VRGLDAATLYEDSYLPNNCPPILLSRSSSPPLSAQGRRTPGLRLTHSSSPPPRPRLDRTAADMEIGSDAIKNARGLAFVTSYTVGFFGGPAGQILPATS